MVDRAISLVSGSFVGGAVGTPRGLIKSGPFGVGASGAREGAAGGIFSTGFAIASGLISATGGATLLSATTGPTAFNGALVIPSAQAAP